MEISTEVRNRIDADMEALLDQYYHRSSSYGRGVILDTWAANKANVIEMLSKHPKWDAENMRIVFSHSYTREFNRQGIIDFLSWATEVYHEHVLSTKVDRIHGLTPREYKNLSEELDKNGYIINEKIRDIFSALGETLTAQTMIGSRTYEEVKMDFHQKECLCNAIEKQMWYSDSPYKLIEENWNGYFVDRKEYQKYISFCDFYHEFIALDFVDNKITQEMLDIASKHFPDIKLVGVGSTIAKLLRKICFSIPCLVEWTKTTQTTWDTTSATTGEVITHTREKVHTLDSKLSELGDATSPLYYTKHTIISVNPLDYLTMSFGHKWASCHTIDKENQRGISGNHYSGCYCSGTLSYMLDSSTIIFYTVDEHYDGNAYETQDKVKRCNFHLSKDGNILVQGRVYPDGRDGGDEGLPAQFRAVMQQVISDCLDEPNFWTLKKGTSACSEYTYSEGTHYRDYTNYSDCNVSIRQNAELESTTVYIGHDPIDPDTGEEHTSEDSLNEYYDERNRETCAWCGDSVDPEDDDVIYCEDNGNYYCCDSCAESDGVHYCEDDDYGNGWHDEEHSFYDNYREQWYYGEPEVETEDGNCYASIDNALNDGYDTDRNGCWYPCYDLFMDAYDNEYYHDSKLEVDIDSCHQYASVDNAIADGCIYIDDTDTWYASESDAEADGYHYIEDLDAWFTEEEYEAYAENQIAEELDGTDNANEENEVA